MKDCIFCKIINNEIPSYKIYEDDHTFAFLDISNDCYGHTLVIPKKHFDNIYDIPEEELACIFKAIKTISAHYKSKGFDGVNIINNSGRSAEQSVFHIHFHIFPRKENDNIKIFPTLEKINTTLNEIHANLKIN